MLLQDRGEPVIRVTMKTFSSLALTSARPHTASALTQASFHVLLLKSLLLGDMSLADWSSVTHEFSSVLISGGHELGRILVTDQLPPPARMQKYWPAFSGIQAKLNAKWTEFVSGNAKL